MNYSVRLFLALLVAAVGVPTGMAQPFTLLQGTDLYGGDIVDPSGIFGTGEYALRHTVESCGNLCMRTPGCIGFAYGTGGDGAGRDCWVKSGPWDVQPNPFRISGRMNFEGGGFDENIARERRWQYERQLEHERGGRQDFQQPHDQQPHDQNWHPENQQPHDQNWHPENERPHDQNWHPENQQPHEPAHPAPAPAPAERHEPNQPEHGSTPRPHNHK